MESFFNPSSIAVFGSFKENKIGYQIAESIVKGGFKKELSLISRSRTDLFGLPSYESINDVPGIADLAIIAVPKQYVYAVVEDCVAKRVAAAVIITSGFSETGDTESEEKIKGIIKNSPIRVIGPNCAGIMNPYTNLFATIEVSAIPGTIGFITQSGAIGDAVSFWAREKEIGFSKFVSYGNRIDVDETVLLKFLVRDKNTKVIAIYIESLKNGRKFVAVAKEVVKIKPVVVIKSGRSRAGKRATSSHTGSMAGEDSVYNAAFAKAGIIRVAGIEDMFDVSLSLSKLNTIKGKKVAVVTNSGGPGILTADKCEDLGLEVPEPGKNLYTKLKQFLLPFASLKNPFDLTVEGTGEQYRKIINEIKDDYNAVIAINVPTPYLDSMSLAHGIVQAKKESSIPIAASFTGGDFVKDSVAYLKSNCIPVFETGERCADAIHASYSYLINRTRLQEKKYDDLNTKSKKTLLSKYQPVRTKAGVSLLKENDAMSLIEENGIPIPKSGFVTHDHEAGEIAEKIGFPVVMKAVSRDMIHKSDEGGVITNIKNSSEAEATFALLKGISADKGFIGVSLYQMLKADVELIAGAGNDPQFGPYILVGMGGIYTEILKDTVIKLAPINEDEASAMIKSLQGYHIISGIRDKEKREIKPIINLLLNLSVIVCSCNEIQEIEANPVFVLKDRVIAVDARVILKNSSSL